MILYQVTKGEVIGKSGGGPDDKNKGRADGPHLHFEVLDGLSRPIDPEPFLTGAAVAAGTATSGDTKTDTTTDKQKEYADSITGKVLGGFSKIYAPVSALASVSGLSSPQKESEIPKPILEEIDRIKELLK